MEERASGIPFSNSHVTLSELTADDFAWHRHIHTPDSGDQLLCGLSSFLLRTISERADRTI